MSGSVIGYLTLTLKIDGKWGESRKWIYLSDYVPTAETDKAIEYQCAKRGKEAARDALIFMGRGQEWHRLIFLDPAKEEPAWLKDCQCEACQRRRTAQ